MFIVNFFLFLNVFIFIAPDELTCQMFCDQVYPDKCTFWIFDKKQTLCDLFDYDKDVFTQSCKKFGGPKEPDFESCATDSDPCVVSRIWCEEKLQIAATSLLLSNISA